MGEVSSCLVFVLGDQDGEHIAVGFPLFGHFHSIVDTVLADILNGIRPDPIKFGLFQIARETVGAYFQVRHEALQDEKDFADDDVVGFPGRLAEGEAGIAVELRILLLPIVEQERLVPVLPNTVEADHPGVGDGRPGIAHFVLDERRMPLEDILHDWQGQLVSVLVFLLQVLCVPIGCVSDVCTPFLFGPGTIIREG